MPDVAVAVSGDGDDLGAADSHRVARREDLDVMATAGQAVSPAGRSMGLHPDCEIIAPPQTEGPCGLRVENQARRSDGSSRILADSKHSSKQLKKNLRLHVSAPGRSPRDGPTGD